MAIRARRRAKDGDMHDADSGDRCFVRTGDTKETQWMINKIWFDVIDEIWFDAGIECPVEIRIALGIAPVLTGKELYQHELMFKTFAQLVKPRDFVEWIFVRVADNRVEALRLKRLNIRLVETPLRNYLIFCRKEFVSADKVTIEKLREKRSAELA